MQMLMWKSFLATHTRALAHYTICLCDVRLERALTLGTYQRHYLIINHIGVIRTEHDDYAIRFASVMNQVLVQSRLI